jgi:hypothetical protein
MLVRHPGVRLVIIGHCEVYMETWGLGLGNPVMCRVRVRVNPNPTHYSSDNVLDLIPIIFLGPQSAKKYPNCCFKGKASPYLWPTYQGDTTTSPEPTADMWY